MELELDLSIIYWKLLMVVWLGCMIYYFSQKPKPTVWEKYLFVFAMGGLLIELTLLFYTILQRMESFSMSFSNVVKTLYRQSARWAVASEQDENDIIRLLHANYAAGYLWALKDIVTTEEFKKITQTDFLTFEQKITKIQDKATQRVVEKCKCVIPVTDVQLLQAIYNRSN